VSNGRVTVFGSSQVLPDDVVYQDAVRLGRLLAEAGYTLYTGGYSGVMEAVSRGAVEAGGRAVGVTVSSWAARIQPNQWVGEEIAMPDLFQRISRLTATDAYVAMPGGLGTLGEVALTWNLFQTHSIPRRPLVLVGSAWRDALECLGGAVRIEPRDLELIRLVRGVEDVVPAIQAGASTGRSTRPAATPSGTRRAETLSSRPRDRAGDRRRARKTPRPDRRKRKS
jgi:uncharacterized protein (TIGR00730 family)